MFEVLGDDPYDCLAYFPVGPEGTPLWLGSLFAGSGSYGMRK